MKSSTSRIRIFICSCMLSLVLISLILLKVHTKSFWIFSQAMAVIYAILSIILFYMLNKRKPNIYPSTIWHQLLHWLGLLGAIYLLNIFVRTGLLDTAQAGILTITLLALTCFSSGVYTDASFMLIGATLAILAAGATLFSSYLTLLMIPTILIVGIIIYIIIRKGN